MPKIRGEVAMIVELQTAIEQSGQSLNQLAQIAGVSSGQLSRFMRNERYLSLPAAGRVCEALGLHLAERPAKRTRKGGK